MDERERLIRAALPEVQAQMDAALAEGGDGDLDSAGLRGSAAIVEEYLAYDEFGGALEHVIYMIEEAQLPISQATFETIQQAAQLMQMDAKVYEGLRTVAHSLDRHPVPKGGT